MTKHDFATVVLALVIVVVGNIAVNYYLPVERVATERFVEEQFNTAEFLARKPPVVDPSIELVARNVTPDEALPLYVAELVAPKKDENGRQPKQLDITVFVDRKVVSETAILLPEGSLYWVANNKRSLVILNHQRHVLYFTPGSCWNLCSDQEPTHVGTSKVLGSDANLAEALKNIK